MNFAGREILLRLRGLRLPSRRSSAFSFLVYETHRSAERRFLAITSDKNVTELLRLHDNHGAFLFYLPIVTAAAHLALIADE
jgi:hypothetical protein